MLCDDLDGWDGAGWKVQEGGGICIHKAASLHCAAETSTISQSNYTPIKKYKYRYRYLDTKKNKITVRFLA